MKAAIFYINYENNIYTFNSGTETMIFDYGVNNEIDRKYGITTLKEYVALVYELYLSDDNPTPLGTLCDYIAKYWKKIRNKHKYDILTKFYSAI